MTVEEKRRELFESWYVTDCLNGAGITITQQQVSELRGSHGDYRERAALHGKWIGFNAALDHVVIELPGAISAHNTDINGFVNPSAEEYDECLEDCRAAIESTGLGLKVIP